MSWPPTIPPNNRTDATDQATNHPLDHNQISDALTELVMRMPKGIRAVATLGTSQLIGASDVALSGGPLAPYTEPNRLYEVVAWHGSTEPAGSAYPGLFILSMLVGSSTACMLSPLHLYMAAGYQGFTANWLFHSGTGGNDVSLTARVTTAGIKIGATGVRTILLDRGYSSQATRGPA